MSHNIVYDINLKHICNFNFNVFAKISFIKNFVKKLDKQLYIFY